MATDRDRRSFSIIDRSGRMRIISFIEDPAVIQRILTHLGLWHVPPRKRAPRPSSHPLAGLKKTLDTPTVLLY
ncbi:MAG: hypothetical protein HY652_04230 [Acidobacteria bacterium]|nr:hypothetical protein [Acidobacteriota bacterium]